MLVSSTLATYDVDDNDGSKLPSGYRIFMAGNDSLHYYSALLTLVSKNDKRTNVLTYLSSAKVFSKSVF